MDRLWKSLKIALIPDYDTSALSQEFRTNFIQNKNRLIPNDHELTRWMKKQINDSFDENTILQDICKSKSTQESSLRK